MDSPFHRSEELFTRRLETTLFALTVSSLSLIIVFSDLLLVKSTSVILLIFYAFLKICRTHPSYRFENSKLIEHRFPIKKEVYSEHGFCVEENYMLKKNLFDCNEIEKVDSNFVKGKYEVKFTLKNKRIIKVIGVNKDFLTDFSSNWISSIEKNNQKN